jgi:hypothetical protein
MADWRRAHGTNRVDWSGVSPRDIKNLADEMMDAAGVPAHARGEYYS